MGKRSNFERRPQDSYDTPMEAVLPLLPHLRSGLLFAEPCAGNGRLIAHLEAAGHYCVHASDIKPRAKNIERADARTIRLPRCDLVITNSPWTRELLHPMILNLHWQAPTWLLLDAPWMFTRQAAPYLSLCRKIVTVGRVKWIPDSKHSGKDDAAWLLFDKPEIGPEFVGTAPPSHSLSTG